VHVLVGVSGGADSMALLRALVQLKAEAGGAGRLFVGHVNHQLRGEDSQADEAWLRRQCERLDVPLFVESVDTAQQAANDGDGVEAAAREGRYRALTKMAEAAGARYVAVAHTRDDQVETVLHRLLRGTGLRGLAGIPSSRVLSPSVSLVRPLLASRRSDVLEYLRFFDQSYRQDATNEHLRYTRNRLRHELLPDLRRNYNADVDEALLRVAELAGEAQAAIEELAANLLAACHPVLTDGRLELQTAPLFDQPESLACEALRLAWREARLPEQAMTRQWWRRLAQFAQSAEVAGGLNLPGNIMARRSAGGLLSLTAPRLP
jgi:tRNA(Ile)-lysidine synthase